MLLAALLCLGNDFREILYNSLELGAAFAIAMLA